MFTQPTAEESALCRQLNSFLEVVEIPRLMLYLRHSLLSYLQNNSAGYHFDFSGMMEDLEFLFYLLDDIGKVQATMPPEPEA